MKRALNFLKRHHIKILTAAVIALIIALRFINLDADTVAVQPIHNQDEGNYSQNARNFVAGHHWINDETNFFLLSPVFSFLQLPFLAIFGVHFWTFRAVNAVASLLTILIGYLFLKDIAGKKAAIIFTLLLGLNFLYLVHNRIAIPETTQGLFLLGAVVSFFYASLRQNPWLFFLAGIFSTLAFLTKASAVVIFAVIAISFLGNVAKTFLQDRHISLANLSQLLALPIACYMLGVASLLAAYHAFMVRPHAALYQIAKQNLIDLNAPQLHNLRDLTYLKELAVSFWQGGEANVWIYFPIPLIFCVWFVAKFSKKYLQNRETLLETILVVWLLVGLADFFIVGYKPARFFVVYLIPISMITALLLTNLKTRLQILFLAFIIITNAFLITKFILLDTHFSLRDASNHLENTVGNHTVAGDNLIHLDNSRSRVYNYYFSQLVRDRPFDLALYLKDHSYPDFLLIGTNDVMLHAELQSLGSYQKVETIKTNTYFPTPRQIDLYQKLPPAP